MTESIKQTLGSKLNSIYELNGKIETTCCRQCGCCRVACPQMKYSEALQIINKVWNEWNKKEKVELLTTCIRYFFDKSLIKPCPLLSGSTCRVYEDRPLNCRLYGLWPSEVWERRVNALSERLDLPKESLPLNVQCPYVSLKGRDPFTESQIQEMFNALDNLDKQILSGGRKSGGQPFRKAESMIRSNWNYRTIHDWVLFFFWGEERLSQMTDIALVANDEQIKDLMKTFSELMESSNFSLPDKMSPTVDEV